jgi:nitroreductase
METLDCIKARASVRSFKPDSIPQGVLEKVLDAAANAPSAGNVQDWEFVVVKDAKSRKAISQAASGQEFVAEAPVVIVVCSNLQRISAAYGDRGRSLYSIQDTSAAIQNIMLAACDLGLGTCWVGAFSEEKVASLLNLPQNVRPLAIIPLGYPLSMPRKSRRDFRSRLHIETF